MEDDKHSLDRLSPVSECDSSEGTPDPTDIGDSDALPKYGYQKKMNTENVPASKATSFCVKKSRTISSQPVQTNSGVPMPVYSKKRRFHDQSMPKLKPPANLFWPTAKHKKSNKGTYKNYQGINSLDTEKRSLLHLSPESRKTRSYYEDSPSKQVHCNSATGSREIAEKDRSHFSSLGHPDSTIHDPSVPIVSTPKCLQKEKSHKVGKQLQTGSREKAKNASIQARKPVHYVTVMPLSSTLPSRRLDAEPGDNPVTASSVESSNKCLASVTANTLKSKDMATILMREHIYDDITRGGQQRNNISSPHSLNTIPIVQGPWKYQGATPFANDNSLEKGQNIRESCIYLDGAPTNITQMSQQGGFASLAQHLDDTDSGDTGEIRQHFLFPSINISQTTPLPGPQPKTSGIHSCFSFRPEDCDSSDTISRIPRRSPQPSVSPFLSASIGESNTASRRSQTSTRPQKKRSLSPFYMDTLNRRSKSPKRNKEPSSRSPKHLSQTRHFSEAYQKGSPFIEGHHQLTVPPSRIPRHSPVFDGSAQHSQKEPEPTPKVTTQPQQAVSSIAVNSQPTLEGLLQSNPFNSAQSPLLFPLNFSPVFLAPIPQNIRSPCPSADVNHPRFGGCLENHDVSLPKPFPLQPQMMISTLMPPLLGTACGSNTNKKSLHVSENSTIQEADRSTVEKMGHNPECGNLPDSKSAFTRSAFKPCSSSGHDQATGCATDSICSASKLVNSQAVKSQARESRPSVLNSSVCTGYMSSLPTSAHHPGMNTAHIPATASLIKRISDPPFLIQCHSNALHPTSVGQETSSYQPHLQSQRRAKSSPLEHELAIHSNSPQSSSHFGGRRTRSEQGSEEDNTDIARTSSQHIAVETTQNGSAKIRIHKRQRDLNGEQSQENASPPKRRRNESVSVALTPTHNHHVHVGNAPGRHETQSSQFKSHRLEIIAKTTTARTADTAAEGLGTLKKDPSTGTVLRKPEMDTHTKSKNVTARETPTQTIPTMKSAIDSPGKETDRKYTLPSHSLPSNCTRSDVSPTTQKSLAASKLQQYGRIANTMRCHTPPIAPPQVGKQRPNPIPKRYVQWPKSTQFLAPASKITDLSVQTTRNRQKKKECMEQAHGDKQTETLKTLPVPFVIEWPGQLNPLHTTPPLETSKQQIRLNPNAQKRKYVTESNASVSSPTGNVSIGENKCQRSTMTKFALMNDKGRVTEHNPKPVVVSSVEKQCLPGMSQFCIRPPRESRGIGMHQVPSHLPPTTKYSHSDNHNDTATSNVTTHDLGKPGTGSNKEENAGNRPLRFHVITDFLVRETTSQRNAFSVIQTSAHKKEKGKEKRGLSKTTDLNTNKIDELSVNNRTHQTHEANGEKSGEKAAKTKTSNTGLEERSAGEMNRTDVHPSQLCEERRPKEKSHTPVQEQSNPGKEPSKSKLNVLSSASSAKTTGLSGYRIAKKTLKDKRTAQQDKECIGSSNSSSSESSAEKMKIQKRIPKPQPFNSAQLNPSKSVSPNGQTIKKKENNIETRDGAPLMGERIRWTNLARMCGLTNTSSDECSGAITARTKVVQRPAPNTTSVTSSTASKVSKWSKYQAKRAGVGKTSDCEITTTISACEKQKEEQEDNTDKRNSVSCKSNPRNFLDTVTDDSTLYLSHKIVPFDIANQFSATSKQVLPKELQKCGSLAQRTGTTFTPTKTFLVSSRSISPTDLQWDAASAGVKINCAPSASSPMNARLAKSAKLPTTVPLDTPVVLNVPSKISTNTTPLLVRPSTELTGKLQSATLSKSGRSTDTPSNTSLDTPLAESMRVLQTTTPASNHTSSKQLQSKQGQACTPLNTPLGKTMSSPNIQTSKPLTTATTNNTQRKDTITTNSNTSSPKGRLTGASKTSIATVECIRFPVVGQMNDIVPNGTQTFTHLNSIGSFSATRPLIGVPSLNSKSLPPMTLAKCFLSSNVCTKFTAPYKLKPISSSVVSTSITEQPPTNSSDDRHSKQPLGKLSMGVPISVALGAPHTSIITTGVASSRLREPPPTKIKSTSAPSSPSPDAQHTNIPTGAPRSQPTNLATLPGIELLAKKAALINTETTITFSKQTLSRSNEQVSNLCQSASNVSSEQFPKISSKQTPRTSNKQSKYLSELMKDPHKKTSIDISRELTTMSSNDQVLNKCSQPIRSILNKTALTSSIGGKSTSSRQNVIAGRELSTTISGEQTTHQINLSQKTDVSEQTNIISSEPFSTGSIVMTHLHNQSNPTRTTSRLNSGVEIAGKSSIGSLTAASGISSRKHNTVLPSLSNDPLSKPGDSSNIAPITNARTLPYISIPQIVVHPSSPAGGPYATYPDKCNTTDITATKPAAGSSTMVTWAILNSFDPSAPNLGPSCTPPRSGATTDGRPAKDPGRSNFQTFDDKDVNISSDNSTNLTWLITPCPSSTPCLSQENQRDLTNQCKSQSLETQHIKEQHGKKTDSDAELFKKESNSNTYSDGHDTSVNSSITDIRTFGQSFSGVDTTNQYSISPVVQISAANTGICQQKQFSPESSQSHEHLQNIRSTATSDTAQKRSQAPAQNTFGRNSPVVKHNALTQPQQWNPERRLTGLNTKDLPNTDLIDGESGRIEERQTAVLSRPRKSLGNSELRPLPNLVRDDVLSRDEVHTKGSSNNRSCRTGTAPSSKDSLLHRFNQAPSSSDQKNTRDSRKTNKRDSLTKAPADSYNVPANANEIIDEFAEPDDCLPCIISAFSLQDRPDVQEQIKSFGNFQHIEVNSTLAKHIINSLGK